MDDKLWERRVIHLLDHNLLASGYNMLTMDDDIFFGWKSVRSFINKLSKFGRVIGYICDHEIVRGLQTHP